MSETKEEASHTERERVQTQTQTQKNTDQQENFGQWNRILKIRMSREKKKLIGKNALNEPRIRCDRIN